MLLNKSEALTKLDEVRFEEDRLEVQNSQAQKSICLQQLDITSDNWFENVLRIYKNRRLIEIENITNNESQTWAFPTISKAFYEPLSHKIGE